MFTILYLDECNILHVSRLQNFFYNSQKIPARKSIIFDHYNIGDIFMKIGCLSQTEYVVLFLFLFNVGKCIIKQVTWASVLILIVVDTVKKKRKIL